MPNDDRYGNAEFSREGRLRRAEPIALFGRGRIVLTLATAVLAALAYFYSRPSPNGSPQLAVKDVTMAQQVAFGQRAAPFLAAEHGGLVSDDNVERQVARIGERLVQYNRLATTGNEFQFHVLADEESPEWYALPGGKIYITLGAYQRLESEGEIAAVLAHAMAHLIHGHFLTNLHQREAVPGVPATAILAEIDPAEPDSLHTDRVRRLVETALAMPYTTTQIDTADQQSLAFLTQAGYHPESLITAWAKWLAQQPGIQQVVYSSEASYRIERLRQLVQQAFPEGAPAGWIR